jgi:hypothetical protein
MHRCVPVGHYFSPCFGRGSREDVMLSSLVRINKELLLGEWSVLWVSAVALE